MAKLWWLTFSTKKALRSWLSAMKSVHRSVDDCHSSPTLIWPWPRDKHVTSRHQQSLYRQATAVWKQLFTDQIQSSNNKTLAMLTSLCDASCRISATSLAALARVLMGSQTDLRKLSGTLPSWTIGPSKQQAGVQSTATVATPRMRRTEQHLTAAVVDTVLAQLSSNTHWCDFGEITYQLVHRNTPISWVCRFPCLQRIRPPLWDCQHTHKSIINK